MRRLLLLLIVLLAGGYSAKAQTEVARGPVNPATCDPNRGLLFWNNTTFQMFTCTALNTWSPFAAPGVNIYAGPFSNRPVCNNGPAGGGNLGNGDLYIDTDDANSWKCLGGVWSSIGLPAFPTTPTGVPEVLTYTPVNPTALWQLPGVPGRSVTGASSTDTILNTDCSNRVQYTTSVAVAITLPTPGALQVAFCSMKIVNKTSPAANLTVTPSGGWTIGGAASLAIPTGTFAVLNVDPINNSNWSVDTSGGNAALKPASADSIRYVTPEGNDSNDGLSFGSAKATVYNAICSLPGGTCGSQITGQGTVYIVSGSSANPTANAGIWLMGSNDPNFSSPPPGWLKYCSQCTLDLIGITNTSGTGPNPHLPKATVVGGSYADNKHPGLWITSNVFPLHVAGLDFGIVGRAIVLGECSNGDRGNTCQSTNVTLESVSGTSHPVSATGQYAFAGPCLDMGGWNYWTFLRDIGCVGNADQAFYGINITSYANSAGSTVITCNVANCGLTGGYTGHVQIGPTALPTCQGAQTVTAVSGNTMTITSSTCPSLNGTVTSSSPVNVGSWYNAVLPTITNVSGSGGVVTLTCNMTNCGFQPTGTPAAFSDYITLNNNSYPGCGGMFLINSVTGATANFNSSCVSGSHATTLDSVIAGNYRANNAASILLDGTLSHGNGLAYIKDTNIDNGGIKVIPGDTGGSVDIENITEEGCCPTASPPVVWFTSFGTGTVATLKNIFAADAGQGAAFIGVETDVQAAFQGGPVILNNWTNTVGPATLPNQGSSTKTPLQLKQSNTTASYPAGSFSQRNMTLVPQRFTDYGITNSASWSITAGSITVTGGQTDPYGGTGAASLVSAGGGTVSLSTSTFVSGNLGDWWIFGAWFKNGGWFPNINGTYLAMGCPGFGGIGYNQSDFYGSTSDYADDGQWHWVWQAAKSNGTFSAHTCSNLTVNAGVTGYAFAPVAYYIPASAGYSNNEVLDFAASLGPVDNNCTIGSFCNVTGHPINADQFQIRSGAFKNTISSAALSADTTTTFPAGGGTVVTSGSGVVSSSDYDNFNRANGSVGANWTTINTFTAPAITSNQVSDVTNNTSYGAVWNADSFGPDEFSELTVTSVNAGTVYYAEAWVRTVAASDNGYNCDYGTGANNSFIRRVIGGSGTTLTTATASPAPAVGDVIRCEIVGTTITFKVLPIGGTPYTLATTTDSTFSSGNPGFSTIQNVGSAVTLDNWSGGNIHPIAQLDTEQDWTQPQHFTQPITVGITTPIAGTLPAGSVITSGNHEMLGTICTNGELALSAGWQSTGSATVTAVKGTGQTCSWTITTGTTTAANPTVTDTLTNALSTANTVCEMNIHGGTHTAVAGEYFNQTTLSATAPVFTTNFTPTAGGTTYFVTRRCGP
jgi:hypothetical protein